MRNLIFVGAALCGLSIANPTGASVLLSDSLSYPDGALATVSGGTWTTHSGTPGQVKVISGRALLSQTNSEDVAAILAGAPYPPTTSTDLYASFTINFSSLPQGPGNYFAHFKTTGASGFPCKIYATTNGVPNGFFRVGVANLDDVPSAIIASNLTLHTTYRIVTRYVVSSAISTLWLEPTLESDTSATASDAVTTTNTVSTFALRESLSSGAGMGTLFVDDIFVGTTFADVVPNATAPPSILTQPQDQTVAEGANVSFSVIAAGAPPLAYQWQLFGTNLPGATNLLLNLSSATTNDDGPYLVVITNAFGATNSATARLSVITGLVPPSIAEQPQSLIVTQGATAMFSVTATGSAPLAYQWRFDNTNLVGATDSSLVLSAVTIAQEGLYSVVITNLAGATNSSAASLTVNAQNPSQPALAYVTYNLKGNGAADWTTNSAQVQAIGHELMYLNPDIVGFNEIPNLFRTEMTNLVASYLPGYTLVISSTTDGFIRNGLATRFPVIAATSHLHSVDLAPFGYTNADFTRDLFEAVIAVPNFPQPLHAFVVHLKSGQGTDESNRRTAECGAISNYFAAVFLPTNSNLHPYLLSGDMNEDVDDPPSSNPQSIQKLISPPTGLLLTTPVNHVTASRLTFSIQSTNGLTKRYDYVMPSALLYSNIASSQVFRSDVITNPPPPLPLTLDDSATGSDHLPVQFVFANPYDKPFGLLSFTRAAPGLSLTWQSVPGQPYRIEVSTNLTVWALLANTPVATGYTFSFNTNYADPAAFFRIYRR